jgi:hypothetical protein
MLKHEFVLWVETLPSRAHAVAIIQRFELGPSFADATRWAAARRLCGPAYYSLCYVCPPCSPLKEDPEPRPTKAQLDERGSQSTCQWTFHPKISKQICSSCV